MGFNKVFSNVGMEHTQETIEKAIQLAKEGRSTPYISDSLGIPYNTIKAWVRGYYPVVRHSEEIKEKARKLISQGNSKLQVASTLGVPYSTLIKWKVPISNEHRRYREELKEKVREMVLNGTSKVKTSYNLGVSLRTVSNWTADIPRNRIAYPQKLRHKIRYLVRKGMSKVEVAKILGVGYTTVTRWTTDLHNNDSKVSGRYFLILRELIEKGHIIANEKYGIRNMIEIVPLSKEENKWPESCNQRYAVWPFVSCYAIMALDKMGMRRARNEELRKIDKLDGFYEWYDPDTGAHNGGRDQLWSAAVYYSMHKHLKR